MKRIYVSVDAEGLPGMFHLSQMSPDAKLFSELREVMSRIVKIVNEELNRLGYEMWVADSHGFMGNLSYLDLPDNVYLIRGSLRPLSMVFGIDRGFSAAMFIGYHPAAGTTRGIAEHTYSGAAFQEIRINGLRASEFYINALVAGNYDVPVILVAGDNTLRRDVEEISPLTVYVEFKESISRYAGVMKPMNIVEEELRKGIRLAIERLEKKLIKPLKIDPPIKVEYVMRRSEYADAGEEIPGMKRINAYTLEYEAKDIIEVYRIMKILALISSAVDTLARQYT